MCIITIMTVDYDGSLKFFCETEPIEERELPEILRVFHKPSMFGTPLFQISTRYV